MPFLVDIYLDFLQKFILCMGIFFALFMFAKGRFGNDVDSSILENFL